MQMHRISPDIEQSRRGSVGNILQLIRYGEATSRSAIARMTGLSPSTAGLRVDLLLRMGLIIDHGKEQSHGGRRARTLELSRRFKYAVGIDLGTDRTTVAIADLTGTVLSETTFSIDLNAGPQSTVKAIWNTILQSIEDIPANSNALAGIAISLPSPVERSSGRMVLPSFMPSWQNVDMRVLFAAYTNAPVFVENDANVVALSETTGQQEDQLLTVVLDARIGSGIITEGHLHQGASGVAGEIGHTSVSGEASLSCLCGVPHCLESVASGGAIIAKLQTLGYTVKSVPDVVDLARTGDPQVDTILRNSGAQIGSVLAPLVNFLNPHRVVLAGALSKSDSLVATIRAEIFKRCLPIITNNIEVNAISYPEKAYVRGTIKLVLMHILSPSHIDELVLNLCHEE